jgi:hypothetical protein
VWERSDLANDGTHPSTSGEQKVGTMLLDFMLNSEFTRPWFVKSVPGDFNGDGTVDSADYVVWRDGLGTVYTQDDYNTWRAHFGQSPGSAAFTNNAVPEPAACIMMTSVIALCLSRRQNRHRF